MSLEDRLKSLSGEEMLQLYCDHCEAKHRAKEVNGYQITHYEAADCKAEPFNE